jgi:predicted nuclease with TOPRIM domain
MSNSLREEWAEVCAERDKLRAENTRLGGEVEQARDDGASMARENLNAARAEADELRRLNTPLLARVAALEKQLSEMGGFVERQMHLFDGSSSEFDGAGEPKALLRRMRRLLGKPTTPEPAVTGTTSDNVPLRKPQATGGET